MNKKKLVTFFVVIIAMITMVAAFIMPTINNMNLGLDLKGGFEILYKVEPLSTSKTKTLDMAAVSSAISKRVNILGVSEPDISVEGKRVRVQLAGIKNNDEARKVISSSAVLTFRDTSDNLLMDSTVLKDGGASLAYEDGKPIVSIKIADTSKFYSVTSALAQQSDNTMVIWLDYKKSQSYSAESQKKSPAYISAATVKEGLNSSSVQISGNFTEKEAQQLADLLNSGSLNFKMTEIYSNVVSPDLGNGAFDKTMFAGAIGILGVIAFMILFYRLPGFVSSVSIATYILATMFVYTLLGGVFTLSGIAALVLGVGMAVDSGVITFERIKDGLYLGRSVKQAYKEGTKKSISTIMDSQLTTLLSAIILYIFGTGSVKGFATMLIISTILALFFQVSIVRLVLGLLVKSGYLDDKRSWFGVKDSDVPDVSKGEGKKFKGFLSDFDFVKNAKYAISISVIIILLGLAFFIGNLAAGNGGMNLGIDFSSGTKITVTEANKKMTANKLTKDIEALPVNVNVSEVKISGESGKIATITIKKAISSTQRKAIFSYFNKNYKATCSDSTVSPVVGQELVKNAIIMSLLSWVGIMIYLSIRFKWDYALSGIVALIHDVTIILAFVAIFRMEVSTEIIAVLLTIIGYSINDSIVAFDRIREQVNSYGRKEITSDMYKEIVNDALQSTIVRSINTTLTTIIPVIFLILLGSSSILTFNITLLIGLIAGANSSIFIAAQLWYVLRKKFPPKEKVHKKHKKIDELEEHIVPGIND